MILNKRLTVFQDQPCGRSSDTMDAREIHGVHPNSTRGNDRLYPTSNWPFRSLPYHRGIETTFSYHQEWSGTHEKNSQITKLQYADDNCILPYELSRQLFQSIHSLLTHHQHSKDQGHQPPPGVNITISRLDLENSEQFPYLDSILVSSASTEKNFDNQTKATYAAYEKLFKNVFVNPGLTQTIKLMVYQIVVISTLLNTCETWLLY